MNRKQFSSYNDIRFESREMQGLIRGFSVSVWSSSCVYKSFLQVLQTPTTEQKHANKVNVKHKIASKDNGMFVCVSVFWLYYSRCISVDLSVWRD